MPHDHADTPDVLMQVGATTAASDATVRHLHRERSFGTGYGNSSGYGSTLRFVHDCADELFRFR